MKHAWGDGGHNGKHGGAIFPEAMRWLWRDYPEPIKAGQSARHPVMNILDASSAWEMVSEGHRFTEGPVANENGKLFFTDIPNNRIHKVSTDGKVSAFAEETGGANGLKFRPDGTLYACANGKRQIVAYDTEGKASAVAEDVNSNDLTVNSKGDIYFTDPGNRQVWLVKTPGRSKWSMERSRDQTGLRSRRTRACCWSRTPEGSLFILSKSSRMEPLRTNSATFICTCPMEPPKAERTG